MKNKRRLLIRLSAILLVSLTVLAVTAAAAGSPGTETDPLVTVSYLNDTFMEQLLGMVDEKLAARDSELTDLLAEQMRQGGNAVPDTAGGAGASLGEADSFTVVSLANGQTLYGAIGCEAMLRVGTASCVTDSSPGLIDETDGSVLGGGAALEKNHLYMMTIDGRGVRASSDTTKLLVRGGYTIR